MENHNMVAAQDAACQNFNSWIELISRCQETHYVAFTPLFEGTLVAFLAKN